MTELPGDARRKHLLIDALNLKRGGGVVVMTRLALAFSSAGYQVTVITARELPGVDFVGTNAKIIVESNARGALRAMYYRRFHLNARAHEIEADAVLGFNYHSPITLPQVTYQINVIPFLGFAARTSAVGFPRALMQGLAARSALRRSTANIFESDYIRSLASNGGGTIPNSSVAYIGAELPNQIASSVNERLSAPFVTVTSGARHKRNDLTLAFFRRILVEEPDAKLVVVGDAEAICANLSPEDKEFVKTSPEITFAGYVGREELFRKLASARALIVFSELESFFMVAIEAMSVGCPVIAADNSSIRESVGSAGLLVPAGDVEAAVSAARDLDSPETFSQYSEAGRNWASNFEAQKCGQDFVSAFERAIWPETGNQQ